MKNNAVNKCEYGYGWWQVIHTITSKNMKIKFSFLKIFSSWCLCLIVLFWKVLMLAFHNASCVTFFQMNFLQIFEPCKESGKSHWMSGLLHWGASKETEAASAHLRQEVHIWGLLHANFMAMITRDCGLYDLILNWQYIIW